MKKISLALSLAIFIIFSFNPLGQSKTKPAATPTPVIIPEPYIQDMIFFESGCADLSKDAQTTLDHIFVLLQKSKTKFRIQLVGHADSSEKNAEEISLKRAESVRDYLIKKGIEASRFEVKAIGNIHPMATNDTAEGRAKNRRVEFNLM